MHAATSDDVSVIDELRSRATMASTGAGASRAPIIISYFVAGHVGVRLDRFYCESRGSRELNKYRLHALIRVPMTDKHRIKHEIISNLKPANYSVCNSNSLFSTHLIFACITMNKLNY